MVSIDRSEAARVVYRTDYEAYLHDVCEGVDATATLYKGVQQTMLVPSVFLCRPRASAGNLKSDYADRFQNVAQVQCYDESLSIWACSVLPLPSEMLYKSPLGLQFRFQGSDSKLLFCNLCILCLDLQTANVAALRNTLYPKTTSVQKVLQRRASVLRQTDVVLLEEVQDICAQIKTSSVIRQCVLET